MKRKYLILAGVLLAVQVLTVTPAAATEKENTKTSSSEEEKATETASGEEDENTETTSGKEEKATETTSGKEEKATETASGEEETTEAEASAAEKETEAEDTESEETEDVKMRPAYDFHEYLKEFGAYTGLTAEVTALPEITEEMTETEISSRFSAASLYDEITEGEVADGDTANIDYVGKKDGVAFDGGTASGYDLGIGSGSFIPGFEEGLVGVKIGDTVDLNLTFPENYPSEDLAGQEVVFTVTVNYIKRAAELSDANIEKLTDGEHKTVDGYAELVKQELEEQNRQQQKEEAEGLLWKMAEENCTFEELPTEVVEFDTETRMNYYRNMFAMYYGSTLEDYCDYQGITVDEFEADMREGVEVNLRCEILAQAILEAEEISVDEDDFREYAEKYAEQYGYPDADTFLENAAEYDILRSIYYDKASDILLNSNTIKESN